MKNLNIEERAKLALLGGCIRWQDTPIQITRTAVATDPMNLSRDGWWKNAEPHDAEGREIIRLLESKGLINSADEFHPSAQWARRRDAARHEQDNPGAAAGDDDESELAPHENETVASWLSRLATKLDINDAQKILWSALQGYASRFRGDSKAAKVLDAKLVKAFLNAVN